MAKAGTVISGLSSVVGVATTSTVANAALAGAVLSMPVAMALSAAIPVAGAILGLAVGDTLFGKKEEKRSMSNYLFSAVCSVIGISLGSALVGTSAAAATAGNLVTEEAIKQTVETGVVAPGIKTLFAITSIGSLIGASLGSMLGVGLANPGKSK